MATKQAEAETKVEAAQESTTITFRNRYPTQTVYLAGFGRRRFREEGLDDEGRQLGVYRTSNPQEVAAMRKAIAMGGVPAWEEDEEERDAMKVLSERRERAAARVAAQAQAKAAQPEG